MRIRVVLSPGGVWKVQRRTILGNWRDVGGDEMAYSRVFNPIGLWWFSSEDDALVAAKKYQDYWTRPIVNTRIRELIEVDPKERG
jgi:hypothetical protein